MKKCNKCSRVLSLDCFNRDYSNKTTYYAICKDCKSNYRQLPKSRYLKSKDTAKRKGKIWNISFEDFEWLCTLECYYCDGKLGKVSKGIGLDRIDSSQGYLFSNVVACCSICNRVKGNNFTLEQTKQMISAII